METQGVTVSDSSHVGVGLEVGVRFLYWNEACNRAVIGSSSCPHRVSCRDEAICLLSKSTPITNGDFALARISDRVRGDKSSAWLVCLLIELFHQLSACSSVHTETDIGNEREWRERDGGGR